MDANEFTRIMRELHGAQTHYLTTGEWDKAATITEEMATNMFSIRREEEAAFLFDIAASHWAHYGDDLKKQNRKAEALEIYSHALENLDKSEALDPRHIETYMNRRSRIEKDIKEL